MSDPIIPGVTLPAGAGVPEPFNANDALIWKTAICKYICKKEKGSFRRTDFLQTLVNGGIPQVGAYDKKEMEKAIHDNNNDFNNLIRYCLDSLHKK